MMKDLNILIIEDVPRDADAIEAELRNESLRFQAKRLETREAFLAELQRSTPDVILSDFTLPEFNALDALHLLQEHHYDIPFILVTGSRSEEVAVECIKEGADDYILKASLKRLPSSILNVLKKKAAERERLRTEEALRRSEEQFRLITENTRDLISLLDLEGRFIYASPSFRTGLGYTPEELSGTDAFTLIHPEDQPALRRTWREGLRRRQAQSAEFRVRGQDGVWRFFESVGNWVFDDDGRPQRSVVVSRDITERKQAEEALRQLPRLILEAQEAERRRVARELHDSVNQMLSSAKFRIQSVEEKLSEREEGPLLDAYKARALLEKAMQEVRLISRNLRPSELDDLGLAAALRSLCREFEERTGIAVELSVGRLPRALSKDAELNLYRIIQEGLNNVEKHARATHVELALKRKAGVLSAIIADDGRGLEGSAMETSGHRPGMGLVDMKERASALGGACTITSSAGGTIISVQVPLETQDPTPKAREKGKTEKDQIAPGG